MKDLKASKPGGVYRDFLLEFFGLVFIEIFLGMETLTFLYPPDAKSFGR